MRLSVISYPWKEKYRYYWLQSCHDSGGTTHTWSLAPSQIQWDCFWLRLQTHRWFNPIQKYACQLQQSPIHRCVTVARIRGITRQQIDSHLGWVIWLLNKLFLWSLNPDIKYCFVCRWKKYPSRVWDGTVTWPSRVWQHVTALSATYPVGFPSFMASIMCHKMCCLLRVLASKTNCDSDTANRSNILSVWVGYELVLPRIVWRNHKPWSSLS